MNLPRSLPFVPMRTLRTIVTALLATAVATGCATTDTTGQHDITTTTRATDAEPAADDNPDVDPGDTVAKVGKTGHTYEDGLKIAILSLKQIRRDPYAAGGKRGQPVVAFRVRITNGTDTKFDPGLATVNLKAGSDGTEAEAVFQDGVDGSFTGSIAPGRSATATFAFAVDKADLGQLDISAAPGFDYDDALFTGSL